MKYLSAKNHKGFTLVEVLMAVVLGGLILTAAAGFVFGIFNLTIMAEKEPMFEEHVDATTRFIEFAFNGAIPPADESSDAENDSTSNSDSSTQNEAIVWADIPGESGLNPRALSFRLPGDLPIFVDEDQGYLPEVECWLVFTDNDGLVLRWRTDDMATEDDDWVFTSTISPYVTSLTYWYYDQEDDKWEDSDEVELADEGGEMMPEFIALTYEHPDGREAKRHLLLPASDSDRPLP